MDQGSRIMQSTDSKSMVLKELRNDQSKYKEDSYQWKAVQLKIDQVVAERYLEFLNR